MAVELTFCLLVPQRHHGIDLGRTASWNVACSQRDYNDRDCDRPERPRISCRNAPNLTCDEPRKKVTCEQANDYACQNEPQTSLNYHYRDLNLLGAKRQANAKLVSLQRYRISHNAKNASNDEQQCDAAQRRDHG